MLAALVEHKRDLAKIFVLDYTAGDDFDVQLFLVIIFKGRGHIGLMDQQRAPRLRHLVRFYTPHRRRRVAAQGVEFVHWIEVRINGAGTNQRRWIFFAVQAYLAFLCSGRKNSCSSRSTCNRPSRLMRTVSPSTPPNPQSWSVRSGWANRCRTSTPNLD